MHLKHAFYKFPFRFDAERLRAEVAAIPEESWLGHPQDYKGNTALPLIATDGIAGNRFEPPMLPTEHLLRSPYLQQVLGQFQTLLGRARLMRLEPGDGVPLHFDNQYYWRTHTRVHIPVVTHTDVRFHCGDEDVHMSAGEAWTFDNWLMHKVENKTPVRRIHLTFDTYGSSAFWAMARPYREQQEARLIPYQEGAKPELSFETFVGAPAMSPGEVDYALSYVITDMKDVPSNNPAEIARVEAMIVELRREWRMVWHHYGPSEEGLPRFRSLVQGMLKNLKSIPAELTMASNGRPVSEGLMSTCVAMVQTPLAQAKPVDSKMGAPLSHNSERLFDRPVFIVSAPRSGSTMLFEMLAVNQAFWTLGDEGHAHVEKIAALNPRSRDFQSNRLLAADATPGTRAQLLANYAASLRSADGKAYDNLGIARPASVRFLEKTPKNALRIPFFKAIFPDAKFIFLQREAKANISAIIEAWRSGRFVTYRDLPGWKGLPWSMLLIPGWRDLNGADVAEIAMRQWRDTNETIMQDLAALPEDDWCTARYEDAIADPASTLARLCAFAGVPFGDRMRALAANPLRLSRYTLTPPSPDKWRKNEAIMASVLPRTQDTITKLSALHARRMHVGEAAQ